MAYLTGTATQNIQTVLERDTAYLVYPLKLKKDDQVPCYVVQELPTLPEYAGGAITIYPRSVQVSCWGTNYGQAEALEKLAKTYLNTNQTDFDLCQLMAEYDGPPEPDLNFARKILEFDVWI